MLVTLALPLLALPLLLPLLPLLPLVQVLLPLLLLLLPLVLVLVLLPLLVLLPTGCSVRGSSWRAATSTRRGRARPLYRSACGCSRAISASTSTVDWP